MRNTTNHTADPWQWFWPALVLIMIVNYQSVYLEGQRRAACTPTAPANPPEIVID